MRRSHGKKIARRVFWKRALVTLALVLAIGFCLLAGFFSFILGEVHVANNRILSEYEQVFRQITHPTNTSKVAFKRKVTPSPGNGSHCFYSIGEVRSFSGNRTNIEAFYANKQFQLQFFKFNQLEEFPYTWLSQLADWNISETNSNKGYYVIDILNSRIDDYTSLDLRCS